MSAYGSVNKYRGGSYAGYLNGDGSGGGGGGGDAGGMQTSLLAKKSVNQPNSVNFTEVDFQSFESNGDFIVVVPTQTFRCQRAGRYLITAYMATNPTGVVAWGNGVGFQVVNNGVALFRQFQVADSVSTHVTGSFVADLALNDELALWNYNTTGIDSEIVAPTQLCVLRVA